MVFQLALAALKWSAASDVQASGFEREGRLHIGPALCRRFWTELLRLVGHQSIPMGVMTVASQDVIPTEMTGCRVVSCSRFVAWLGLETMEAMEANLLLRRRKRHVQIRVSSHCCSGGSPSLRHSELGPSASKNVRGVFQTSRCLVNSRSKEKGRLMILEMPRRLFVPTLQVAQSRFCFETHGRFFALSEVSRLPLDHGHFHQMSPPVAWRLTDLAKSEMVVVDVWNQANHLWTTLIFVPWRLME